MKNMGLLVIVTVFGLFVVYASYLDARYQTYQNHIKKNLDTATIANVEPADIERGMYNGFSFHTQLIKGYRVTLSNKEVHLVKKYYFNELGVRAEYVPQNGEKINAKLIIYGRMR